MFDGGLRGESLRGTGRECKGGTQKLRPGRRGYSGSRGNVGGKSTPSIYILVNFAEPMVCRRERFILSDPLINVVGLGPLAMRLVEIRFVSDCNVIQDYSSVPNLGRAKRLDNRAGL